MSTDIIEASALAFLQVINRIAMRASLGIESPTDTDPAPLPESVDALCGRPVPAAPGRHDAEVTCPGSCPSAGS